MVLSPAGFVVSGGLRGHLGDVSPQRFPQDRIRVANQDRPQFTINNELVYPPLRTA